MDIKDEIITINYYLMDAIDNNNLREIRKYKILLDNLINILLKNEEN